MPLWRKWGVSNAIKKVGKTMDIRKLAHDVQDKVVAFRRDLHQNPEPSLEEFRTSKQIAAALDEMGVPYRMINPTGVIAEVKGTKGEGKTVALRGDIDALSIQEKTDVPFRSQNDGIMHACGHDTHAAMLLGSVMVLNSIKDTFSGTVRFIFQPAEEVGKGAALAIEQGCLEGVDGIFGVHSGSMKPVGQISSNIGPRSAATDHFIVKIKGKACHGAAPQAGVDATVCGASVVMNLQTMVSREFAPTEPLVVTVGSFHSGSRFNIVSGEAVLEGTIRSFSREVHAQIPIVLSRIIEQTCAAFRCEADVDYRQITEVLINDGDMVNRGLASARKIADSEDLVKYDEKGMGGEDFAEYTKYVPGAFFSLGTGGKFPAHSDYFFVEEEALEVGVAFYAQCAIDFLAE